MNSRDSSVEILQHLERFGVRDKDAAAAAKKPHSNNGQRDRRSSTFDATIDLHGMIIDTAMPVLRSAIHRCKDMGKHTLLVIHGQGHHSRPQDGAVLKTMVRQMLDNELGESIRDYRGAMLKDGGDGATVVRLR